MHIGVPLETQTGETQVEVTLEDYTATEKISYLPRKLTTEGTPDGYTPLQGQTQ